MISILFVTSALGYGVGGSEKALIELIQHLDLEKYSITVLSMELEPELPYKRDGVTVIYGCDSYQKISSPLRNALLHIRDYSIKQILGKTKIALASRIPFLGITDDKLWNYYSKYISTFSKSFDIAVGYGPGKATYYTIDKVDSKKKILWVDTDLAKAHFNLEYLKRYYKIANEIVFVDKSGINRFGSLFPEFSNKLHTVRNIIPTEEIRNLSKKDVGFMDDYQGIRILSVGRLCEAKAFHLAVEAANIIKNKGHSFRWYIIGWGERKSQLRKLIEKYRLEQEVILLGQKLNPYPFFLQSDIYVQTSVYEGSPITIEEAMVFNLPIVSTNIPCIYEIINNNKNGLICDMSAKSIAASVIQLITDHSLRAKFQQELTDHPMDYNKPIKDFDALIDSLILTE